MKQRKFLILVVLGVLLAVLAVPAFAKEECFKGLAPMTVEGLYIGATNPDVVVVAVFTKPGKVVAGGVKGIVIAGDVVVKTATDLAVGGAKMLCVAATNFDVAVVAVFTKPDKVVAGGVKGLAKAAGWLGKIAFGNCRH